MNVLLVEDNLEQVSSLVRHIQECLGEKTVILGPYDQFSDVLPYVSRRDIKLALVDIQLHNDRYAGIHIAEMLQQLSAIPILFISGITDREIVEKAEKVRCSDFLQKPYDKSGFERALRRVIGNQEDQRSGAVKVAFYPRSRDKYWIKTDRSEYQAVFMNDILCVEALDHYCRIYVSDLEAPLVTKASLKRDILEGGLMQHPHFFQLSRSVVINVNQVERVIGNFLFIKGLKLIGNRKLTIPKEKRKEVFQTLGITGS
ncbi:MAG: LytTR family DNA-binding domain-containing protein [Bacteroidota bacterium]